MQKDVSLDGNILYLADCLVALKDLPDNSIDSVVCDPPYGLGKQPDLTALLTHWLNNESMPIKGKGFMGKDWDAFVPQPAVWKECLRVLKPGGHLIAFFGARTYDLGALSIRMAGFEIRDQLMWIYSQGMPKNLDIGKAISKHPNTAEVGKKWNGYGTGLKPSHEPICLARKPFVGTVVGNVLLHGVGAINIDACRIEGRDRINYRLKNSKRSQGGVYGAPKASADFDSSKGRWPANVITDGSDCVRKAFPAASGQHSDLAQGKTKRINSHCYGGMSENRSHEERIECDPNASRFFYCAKTSSSERHEGLEDPGTRFPKGSTLRQIENKLEGDGRGNYHVSVKPVDLMRHLIRLVTPYGGTVLDPFMGSGTTGKAARLEKAQFIGMELDPGYFEIAKARIAFEVNKLEQVELFNLY